MEIRASSVSFLQRQRCHLKGDVSGQALETGHDPDGLLMPSLQDNLTLVQRAPQRPAFIHTSEGCCQYPRCSVLNQALGQTFTNAVTDGS